MSDRASIPRRGVRIAGVGSSLPPRVLTNPDLVAMMDTTEEWILQRTGIRTRHIIGPGESALTLSVAALSKSLADARLDPRELDLVVMATMSPEMSCPPTSCRVAAQVGAVNAGAFDVSGACCGFVFSLNLAHDLIKGGSYRNVAVIGADTLSTRMDYSTAGRGTAIIFGDAAAAVVLRATDDASKGIIAQAMHADGSGWKDIYVPELPRDFPEGVAPDPSRLGHVQMNGSTVFKFAVGTFPKLIEETLAKAGLASADIDMYICHQSNARILEAARQRFGIPHDRLYVNIDRVGNTVAASVPLCLDELVKADRVRPGMKVMFLGFGGGLTWGSSLWQL